jgi:hypothetical protein
MGDFTKCFTLVLILVLLIVFCNATTYMVKADSAEPISFSSGLTLYSPVNTTYSSNIVDCNCSFNYPRGAMLYFNYSIDGKYQDTVPLVLNPSSNASAPTGMADGVFQLPELLNGSHQLSIGIEEDLVNGATVNKTGWINSVYFVISSSQTSPTLTPILTPTPTVPEFPSLIIVTIIAMMLALAILVSKRKKVNSA